MSADETIVHQVDGEAVADAIERVIIRRLHNDRVAGYTLEMSREIAALSHPQPQEAVETLKAERDEAKQYLRNLLTTYIYKYFNPVPGWEPLPDLIGMLTQMDNASTMTEDILIRANKAEARIAELEKENERKTAALQKIEAFPWNRDTIASVQRIARAALAPDASKIEEAE